MSAHRSIYQMTGGRIGHGALHHHFLLLHSTGTSSGKVYITPLSYFRDGDNFILVASNWGQLDHPHWFKNLVNRPDTLIQVGTREIPVRMNRPQGEEYLRLWKLVTGQNRHYSKYQTGLDRQIPIVVLEPVV